MSERTRPTQGQTEDQHAANESPRASRSNRAFGQRPDGGSAETVEPISDAYYPSAAVELGKDNDHVLRLSRDDAMTNEGFKSLPNEDDELTAGVGQKEIAPVNPAANGQRVEIKWKIIE